MAAACDICVPLPPTIPLPVWLINYKHFVSWKPYPGSWIPDPATVEFSIAKVRGAGLWRLKCAQPGTLLDEVNGAGTRF